MQALIVYHSILATMKCQNFDCSQMMKLTLKSLRQCVCGQNVHSAKCVDNMYIEQFAHTVHSSQFGLCPWTVSALTLALFKCDACPGVMHEDCAIPLPSHTYILWH